MKRSNIIIFFTLISILFLGCNDGQKTAEGYAKLEEVKLEKSTKKMKKLLYAMPPITESLELIREEGRLIKTKDLFKSGLTDNYPKRKSKALILGMYSVSLAHSSFFGKTQETINYLKDINLLATQLGVTDLIPYDYLENQSLYMNNPDSLESFINSMLLNVDSYLKESEEGHLAALIMLGGWIESMHLAKAVYLLSQNKTKLQEKIAEQKPNLELLIDMLYSFEKLKNEPIMQKIKTIEKNFNKVEFSEEETTTKMEDDKTLVIGGENELYYNEETILAILNKIELIRNEIVN